jgi:uncharacterized protein YukE
MKANYRSLQEAATAMKNYSQSMNDPINTFEQEVMSRIGEQSTEGWGGTAAAEASNILTRLRHEIAQLQTLCSDFSGEVNKSAQNYQAQDATAQKKMEDITPA